MNEINNSKTTNIIVRFPSHSVYHRALHISNNATLGRYCVVTTKHHHFEMADDGAAISWSGGDHVRQVALDLADEMIGTRVFDVTKLHEQKSDRVTVAAKTLFFAPKFVEVDPEGIRTGPVATDFQGMFLFFKPSSALMYGYLVTKYYATASSRRRMVGLTTIENERVFTLLIPTNLPRLGKVDKKEVEKDGCDYDTVRILQLVEDESSEFAEKRPALVRISLSRIATVVRTHHRKMQTHATGAVDFDAQTVDKHMELAIELAHVAEKRSEFEYDAGELLSDESTLLQKRNNLDVVLHGRGDYRGRTEWQVMKAFADKPAHVAMMYLMTFSDRDGVYVFTITDAYKKRKRAKEAAAAEPSSSKTESKKKKASRERGRKRDKPESSMCPAHEKRRTLALVATYKLDNLPQQRVVHAFMVRPRRPEAAEAVRMLVLHIVQAVCSPSRRLSFEMPITLSEDDGNILVNLHTRDKAWRTRSLIHEGIASGVIGAEQIAQIASKKHPTIRRRALKTAVYTPVVNGAPKPGLAEVWTLTATAIKNDNASALDGLLLYNTGLALSTFAPTVRYNTPVSLVAAFGRPEMLEKIETFARILLKLDTDKVRDRIYTKSVVEVAIQHANELVLGYFRDTIKLPMYFKVRSSDPKLAQKLALQGDVAEFTKTIQELIETGATISFRTAAKIVVNMTKGSPPPSRFKQIVDIFNALRSMQLLPVCPLALRNEVADMVSDRDPLAGNDGNDGNEYTRLIQKAENTSDSTERKAVEDQASEYLKDRRHIIDDEIGEERQDALDKLERAMGATSSDIVAALVKYPLDDNAKWVATEVDFGMVDTLMSDGVNHARVVGLLWDAWDSDGVANAEQMAEKLVEFGAPTFFAEQRDNKDLPGKYVQWALGKQTFYDGLHQYDSILLDQTMPRYGVPPAMVPRESVTVIGANGDDSSSDDSDFGSDDDVELEEGDEMEECVRTVELGIVIGLISRAWISYGDEWAANYAKAASDGLEAGNKLRLDKKRSRKRPRSEAEGDTVQPTEETKRQRLKQCIACGAVATARCSQCNTAAYCSKACQSQHWPNHIISCKI